MEKNFETVDDGERCASDSVSEGTLPRWPAYLQPYRLPPGLCRRGHARARGPRGPSFIYPLNNRLYLET